MASRRPPDDPPRKTGFQIRQSILLAVREAVDEGAAPSQNAFVERALVRELKELRRQRVYEAYARAARDPAFRQDMESVSDEFDPAAGDGLASA